MSARLKGLLMSFFFLLGTLLQAHTQVQSLMQQEILFPNLTLSQKQQIPTSEKEKKLTVKVTWIDWDVLQDYLQKTQKADKLSLKEIAEEKKRYITLQQMDIAYVFLFEITNSTTLLSSLSFEDPFKDIYLLVHGKPVYPWFADAVFFSPFTDSMKGRLFFKKMDVKQRPVIDPGSHMKLVVDGLIPKGMGGVLALKPDFEFEISAPQKITQKLNAISYPSKEDDLVQKGLTLYKQGYLSPSLYFFRLAYKNFPSLMNGLLLEEVLMKKDKKKGLSFLQRLSQAYPEEPEIELHFARYWVKEDRCDKALPFYQKALKALPEDVAALRQTAHCLEAEGQEEQAIQMYRKILKILPEDEEAKEKIGETDVP